MLSGKLWWEKDFSWSQLDKFEESRNKSISQLIKIQKPLNLLDSMDIENIPFQKSNEDVLKYVPPFKWGEPDEYETYMENKEYDKAYEILIHDIKSFQSKTNLVPAYLFRRAEEILTILYKEEYYTLQRIGCITNEMGLIFMENGEYEIAKSLFLECIYKWDYLCTFPYYYLAKIYHRQKEFELEYIVLKILFNTSEEGVYLDSSMGVNINLYESLRNVEYYLEHGEFEEDCLPFDPTIIGTEIKKAKTLLNNGNIEKGLELLENLVKKGTYTNTVYFTLYTYYIKLENWDCAIKICQKAIDVLGLYSKDRIKMYTIYKNRAIKYKNR